VPFSLTLSTLEGRSDMRSACMYRVDITADLNDEDETGYLLTFLGEARDPGQITPGAIVTAGDEDAAAVCQVIDLVPAGDGVIVHLRLLPGLVEDHQALAKRSLASSAHGRSDDSLTRCGWLFCRIRTGQGGGSPARPGSPGTCEWLT
jgi:hypothetical protein